MLHTSNTVTRGQNTYMYYKNVIKNMAHESNTYHLMTFIWNLFYFHLEIRYKRQLFHKNKIIMDICVETGTRPFPSKTLEIIVRKSERMVLLKIKHSNCSVKELTYDTFSKIRQKLFGYMWRPCLTRGRELLGKWVVLHTTKNSHQYVRIVWFRLSWNMNYM